MEQQNKEIYWSQFTEDYEDKQAYVAGDELISVVKTELLTEQKLGKVLELGCGTGLYTETLINNAESITATDLSDEMIEMAKTKRGGLKNVEFQKADALNLEFEENSFDTVFMANLIHIIGNAEKLILESKRILKKGGTIIITSFSVEEMGFFGRIGLGFRFIKSFGKPPEEATREKTTKEYIETMLKKNCFEIQKNKVLGKKSKSIYITAKYL
jgi:ubiquinone/menaquinone biosynthesis C-methylase UbiE